jgi:hypothetical protein
MKKSYTRPQLVEFGTIDQITLGATGSKPDAIVTVNPPSISPNPNNPSCNNNVASGYCYTINI